MAYAVARFYDSGFSTYWDVDLLDFEDHGRVGFCRILGARTDSDADLLAAIQETCITTVDVLAEVYRR